MIVRLVAEGDALLPQLSQPLAVDLNAVGSGSRGVVPEYIAHVVDKKCPAGQCKALVTLQIDPELCKGCSKCSRVCPVGAISGEIKKPFKIDTTKCIKCGACKEGCPFHAVKEV